MLHLNVASVCYANRHKPVVKKGAHAVICIRWRVERYDETAAGSKAPQTTTATSAGRNRTCRLLAEGQVCAANRTMEIVLAAYLLK